MRLKVGLDFPGGCHPLPEGRFRFKPEPERRRVRYPIATESALQSFICPSGKDSLGVFHNIMRRFYPLLQAWFRGAISPSSAATVARASLPCPRMSTQGRLRCTQHTILCTAMQVLSRFVRSPGPFGYFSAVAQEQVSTVVGSVGICHYTSPENLNPQHPP